MPCIHTTPNTSDYIMIATIILSLSLAAGFIAQTLATYGCRLIACIRHTDVRPTEVELPPARPTICITSPRPTPLQLIDTVAYRRRAE